jgi:hypothetical protein
LSVSEKQARKLKIGKHQKISPYLEECCLRASANVSYENAAKDIYKYTGISLCASTQQRIVQRYEFPEIECGQQIEEISVDGGKVRLRTEKQGEPCIWKDYKAFFDCSVLDPVNGYNCMAWGKYASKTSFHGLSLSALDSSSLMRWLVDGS